jgi:uncharacterized protein with HEPN domain
MLDAIQRIEQYTTGMGIEDFVAKALVVDAVIRTFIIIGEAARAIPSEIEAQNPDILWADMRDMRNVVIHEYFRVHLPVVWQTMRNDPPSLAVALRSPLNAEP